MYCEECCIFSLATRHSATLPLSPPCRHPQHSECGDNDCNVTDKLTLCHHCPLRSAHYRYTIVGLQPSQRWTRNKLSGTPVRLGNCHCWLDWAGSELRSTHSLVKIVSDLEYFSSWHFNKWWSWSIYCSAHHSTRCRASYKCWDTAYCIQHCQSTLLSSLVPHKSTTVLKDAGKLPEYHSALRCPSCRYPLITAAVHWRLECQTEGRKDNPRTAPVPVSVSGSAVWALLHIIYLFTPP